MAEEKTQSSLEEKVKRAVTVRGLVLDSFVLGLLAVDIYSASSMGEYGKFGAELFVSYIFGNEIYNESKRLI